MLALLSLLAFLGVVFYTFAAQERSAADYFSESAKSTHYESDSVWPHLLEHVLVGPSEKHKGSILYSPTRRHSLVANLLGSDVYPGNSHGVDVVYDPASGEPVTRDPSQQHLLDFVDSPAAVRDAGRRALPDPDVDYTYPDINNLFLAWRGWAVRYDAAGGGTQVPVMIPSFFRPQYMKRAASSASGRMSAGFEQSFGSVTAPVSTNPHWAYAYRSRNLSGPAVPEKPNLQNRDSVLFAQRSFRPHPSHVAGFGPGNRPVRRYLTDDEAALPGISLTAGGFPFLPKEAGSGRGNGIAGDLGIWTGSHELAYELDADNDGDGITEGIWLDLRYPIQEIEDAAGRVRTYAVLHSVTIYDLDGLFNLNVHGNKSGLSQSRMTQQGQTILQTLPQAAAAGDFSKQFLSRSHHGLGPNEVNPIWGLRRPAVNAGPFDRSLSDEPIALFAHHFGRIPSNCLEQGNMEWLWLLTGRGDYARHHVKRDRQTGNVTSAGVADLRTILSGRWGDEQMLFYALHGAGRRLQVADLPRPGRAGLRRKSGYSRASTTAAGFDDNRDRLEGEGVVRNGRVVRRAFGHPVSFSGRGRRTRVNLPQFNANTQRFEYSSTGGLFPVNNPLVPILLETGRGAERLPAYIEYSTSSDAVAGRRYALGFDGNYSGTHQQLGGKVGDDLLVAPVFDDLVDDPLETIFDRDFDGGQHDTLYPIADTVSLQWPLASQSAVQLRDSQDQISFHSSRLAPYGLSSAGGNREMFTTYSNSLRYFPMPRSSQRPWEFSADTDRDGHLEFPPAFGNSPASGKPYSATDPFRPPVRRLLTNELGERRRLAGGVPLSINHILDVDRTGGVPPEGTDEYLKHLRRSGLRLRRLTEHPVGSDASKSGLEVLDLAAIPTLESRRDTDRNTVRSAADVPFPPRTFSQQEFWARRDRQQLARDIYVLLYTTGGVATTRAGMLDYTTDNDPDSDPGKSLYTHDQLRQMAQFAVNLVDAMDRDSVITKFEYDKNLGNGWNLDDDAFTAEEGRLSRGKRGSSERARFELRTSGGLYPEDNLTRGVVYGVESQRLTFSEVLAVRCGQTQKDDHDATLHDDSAKTRDHLFIELSNVRPEPVPLGSSRSRSAETGTWRLARFDRTHPANPIADPQRPSAAVTFLSDAAKVGGGAQYVIATASDASVVCSDFFVDMNLDGIFELIAPDLPPTDLPTSKTMKSSPMVPELKPRTDMDLIHPDHAGRFVVTDDTQRVAGGSGAFLDDVKIYTGNDRFQQLHGARHDAGGDFSGNWGEVGFDLVLQRRMNQNLPTVASTFGQDTDVNPWIEVDRIRVEFSEFALKDGDTEHELTGAAGRLARLTSQERRIPLDDSTRKEFTPPHTYTDYRLHTIGSEFNNACLQDPARPHNDSPGADHNPVVVNSLWQPHFDRDFTSVGELLHLPVIGPRLLTQRLNHARQGPFQQILVTNSDHRVSGAASLFLAPDLDLSDSQRSYLDNRWYRLFQFVEVPSRANRMLGNYLSQQTVPGKLNLNMIRHQEVLAGLIDDPVFADTDSDRLKSPFLSGRTPGSAWRDRWMEFVRERDGRPVDGYFDPTPAQPGSGDESTEFLIPGTPNSRPFRSFSYTSESGDGNGIHHTILRHLMADRDEDGDGHDNEAILGDPSHDDNNDLQPDDATRHSGVQSNRHWLELGANALHINPIDSTTTVERHQVLSKILNNLTTTSHTFIMFATAAYFEAWEDPASGLFRIGGRMDLEGTHGTNPGWQQRAVFVLDRTEALDAWDARTQTFDWRRLVKFQAQIE